LCQLEAAHQADVACRPRPGGHTVKPMATPGRGRMKGSRPRCRFRAVPVPPSDRDVGLGPDPLARPTLAPGIHTAATSCPRPCSATAEPGLSSEAGLRRASCVKVPVTEPRTLLTGSGTLLTEGTRHSVTVDISCTWVMPPCPPPRGVPLQVVLSPSRRSSNQGVTVARPLVRDPPAPIGQPHPRDRRVGTSWPMNTAPVCRARAYGLSSRRRPVDWADMCARSSPNQARLNP